MANYTSMVEEMQCRVSSLLEFIGAVQWRVQSALAPSRDMVVMAGAATWETTTDITKPQLQLHNSTTPTTLYSYEQAHR